MTETTATIATLRTQAVNTDTGATIPKTAPDQIAVTGRLPGGAVAGMHFRGGALRTTPFAWEIDGTRGSLRITGDVGLPMSAALTVEGARDKESLSPLAPPAEYDRFPELIGTPAHNVAHLYAQIVEALSGRDYRRADVRACGGAPPLDRSDRGQGNGKMTDEAKTAVVQDHLHLTAHATVPVVSVRHGKARANRRAPNSREAATAASATIGRYAD
ncbi:hypothetical protein [Streptomyces olivaceoviridis]|uniref:hypothetical protein n=1 Tax=Streptomyces olivaceoviridis TaxID=1921 RepID=UPI0036BA9BFC